MGHHVIAIDQGTSSTRAIIFDRSARIISIAQLEHRQIFPEPGWVEHDAKEIWRNTRSVVGEALGRAHLTARDIAAIGITNQRETAVVWDRATGEPVCNAIVWQDARTQEIVDRLASTGGIDRFRERTGLPLNTYFAGTKLMWVLEHVPGVRERAEAGDILFGTIDAWLVWHLTGGPNGGLHVTDVTNASRTLFMDLRTLDWDPEILEVCDIPRAVLPQIRSSSEVYGLAEQRSLLGGVPIAGILGDQQAALFGQAGFRSGDAKNTYGTGSFLLSHTGEAIVHSRNGLLTTVAARLGDQPPTYALEGSIAVTGSLVQWLRDNLGLISTSAEIETLASSVDDNGGCYIVPAFSGLLAPYWRPDARGAIVGLTRYVHRGHLARAALESTAYQTRDVLDACNADSGIPLTELRVDGGMVANDALMQFQADILGVDVVRPAVSETTALGAAAVAGLATGFWPDTDAFAETWREERRWTPRMPERERAHLYGMWQKAVTKSLDWVEEQTP